MKLWGLIKNTIYCVIIALGASAVSFLAPDIISRYFVYPKVTTNTYMTWFGDKYGTAFQVWHNEHSYIVTAHHVCVFGYNNTMNVRIDGVDLNSRVIISDEDHDICVIESGKSGGLSLGTMAEEYEQIFYVGYPLLQDLKQIYSGVLLNSQRLPFLQFMIESQDDIDRCYRRRFQLLPILNSGKMGCYKTIDAYNTTIRNAPGASGAPVLNKHGVVIGMVSQMNLMGTAIIIDVHYITKLIETYERQQK